MGTQRGVCLVFVSPSGGGKTSMMLRILSEDAGIVRSVNATTRAPRIGEQDGVDYYFHTAQSFAALVENEGMLEHATVHGNSYGIPRAPVEAALGAGMDMVFVVDWQGHLTLRQGMPDDVVGVFLQPPSLEELERRMLARGDKPADVALRMLAAEEEMSHSSDFEHSVLNEDFEQAVQDVQAILHQARAERANACTPVIPR